MQGKDTTVGHGPANGFATHGSGRPRTQLDEAAAHDLCEQACPTASDWSGRLESCYGSEGWRFESLQTHLRARH
jgi:hypothetical protein